MRERIVDPARPARASKVTVLPSPELKPVREGLRWSRRRAAHPAANAVRESSAAGASSTEEATLRPAPPEKGQTSLRKTIRLSLIDGLCGEIVTACTTGATLTAWALYLGGSTFLIGVLTALPFLAQLLHLPAALVIERFGRRRMALLSWLAARSVYALLIPLPFLALAPSAKQSILLLVASVSAVFTVVGTNAWTAWMGEIIPVPIRGRYYGRRYGLSMFGGAVGALLAGLLIDHLRRGGAGDMGPALSTVALGIVAAGAVSTACLWKHRRPAEEQAARLEWRSILRPFRDPAAQPLLRYQFGWNLAVALSGPFIAMHMAVNLKLGFILIAAHAVVSAAFRMLFSPLWGRLVDTLGARPVLVFCSFGICVLPFVFLWPTPDAWMLIWVDALVAGTLWSGHAVAIFSLPLRIAPAQGRASYVAAFTAVAGVGYGISSILGGVIAKAVPASFTLLDVPLVNVHVLLVLSLCFRILAARLSRRIVEPDAQAVPALVGSLSDEVSRRAAYVGRLATAPLAWGLGWARR